MHDLLISAINLKEAPLLALVWMQKGRRKEEEEERKRKEGGKICRGKEVQGSLKVRGRYKVALSICSLQKKYQDDMPT